LKLYNETVENSKKIFKKMEKERAGFLVPGKVHAKLTRKILIFFFFCVYNIFLHPFGNDGDV